MDNKENLVQQTPALSPVIENQRLSSSFPSSKRNLVTIIVVIFLVLVGSLGGYYIGVNKNSRLQQNTNTVGSPSLYPTQSPNVSNPQPTNNSSNVNLPIANLRSLSGKLIFRDGDSILVSDANGSNPMRLVDSKNRLGFAGWSESGKVFYYTELVGTTGTVYKKDLSSGVANQLFTFDSSEKNIETFVTNVNISRDGKYAIYSHNNGDLSLFDLTNKTDKKLLSQAPCLSYRNTEPSQFNLVKTVYAGNPGNCHGYYYPYWSPDGKKVVVRKIFYEGATQIVINPFEEPVQEKDTKAGGSPPTWSKDSAMLVIPGAGYGGGSLYLVTHLDNPDNKDILADDIDFKGSTVNSGAMSENGKIAFTYSNYEKQKNGIALYTPNDNAIKHLLDVTDDNYVQLWLSDNKTLLYRNNRNIWSLDTVTMSQNKLPIYADGIIGIVQ